MTADQLHDLLIPIHGVFGVLTLLTGLVALSIRKDKRHGKLGRLFTAGMLVAITIAAPVILAYGNVFLVGIGTFSAYLVTMGWILARERNRAGRGPASVLATAMIAVGATYAGWGAVALSRGSELALVAVVLGVVAVAVASRHRGWLLSPPAERKPWVLVHLGAMGGGLIAAVTAFTTATVARLLPDAPQGLFWLGPTVLLTPWVVLASQRYHRAPQQPTA